MTTPEGPDEKGLRITLITPGYPPDRGGVEEHVGQIARRLAAGPDRVRVLTATLDEHLRRAGASDVDGVHVRRLRALPTPGMSTAPGLVVAGLAAGLRAGDDEVVHVHSYHASSGFTALAGVRHPVVLTPHYHGAGHTAAARLLHRGYGYAGRLVFRAAHAVVCVSEAEREIVERDFPATVGRTRVIPNGVPTKAIRAAQPWPDEPTTVLSVGRLEPYKGHARVIEAMRDVPDAQLVVVGRGPQAQELRELAAGLALADRVRVLTDVTTPDLHRWLRTAAVLVSLSRHEAFGMAPVEAGAAGARVVLSDIPAHAEIAREYLPGAATLLPVGSAAPEVAAAVGDALARRERVVLDVPDWDDVTARTRAVYLEVVSG